MAEYIKLFFFFCVIFYIFNHKNTHVPVIARWSKEGSSVCVWIFHKSWHVPTLISALNSVKRIIAYRNILS